MPRKTAVRSDWQNNPLPTRRCILSLERCFSAAEMDRIRLGVIPEEMEEKWFIFFEDGRLFLHRSWTGFCVYVVEFAERDGQHVISKVEANREPRQYSEKDSEFDARLLSHLIDVLLLDRWSEFPKRKDEE